MKRYNHDYKAKPENKARKNLLRKRPDARLKEKLYKQRPAVKARNKFHRDQPEAKTKKKLYKKRYDQRPEVKEKNRLRARRRRHDPQVKATITLYKQQPHVKAKTKLYEQQPHVRKRRNNQRGLRRLNPEYHEAELIEGRKYRFNKRQDMLDERLSNVIAELGLYK
jgi:hypothetical protein